MITGCFRLSLDTVLFLMNSLFSIIFQMKYHNSPEQWTIVDREVKELVRIGVVVPCDSEPGEFISTIFIVPKPNGKFRPVINERYLNVFIHYEHFKQETFSVVLDLLQENNFLTSIDLQNAYFSIPIHELDQKYLKFIWNGYL